MDAAMLSVKSLPDVSKIQPFSGSHFKRWQEKIHDALDVLNLAEYLTQKAPDEDTEHFEEEMDKWKKGNKVCRYTILSTLSNELYDVYCSYKSAWEIWDILNKKYVLEDAGSQKYAIGNFLNFQMVDEKDVSSQIHDFHKLINDLKTEEIDLPESFVSGCLIEKLPESWRDYKNCMKHKRKQMSLEDVIVHIRIEEKNRQLDRAEKAKELNSKANIVESSGKKPQKFQNKKKQWKPNNNSFKSHDTSFKRKGNCFVCGKPGHYAAQCRNRHKKENGNPPKANLVEGDDVIAAVVATKVNLIAGIKEWVVDSGATKHICGDRNAFSEYMPVREGEEHVYLGDSHPAPIIGKGKVLLKLTSGKILALSNVLHVPNIRCNLVSVYVLCKAGVNVSFGGDKFILSKNGTFVGKGYCANELFMLNVLEVLNINKIASSSAYFVDSIDMWHGRLGHVNFSYIKKMKDCGLLTNLSLSKAERCDVCVESKSTKKSHKPILQRESELLSLIHSDLGDLKHIMTRGGKRFYITFIDDFSRFTRLYLLKSKDEACEYFKVFKAEVENQLDKKIKRLRTDRGGEYKSNPFNEFCEIHGIIHKSHLLIHLNLMG